MLFLGEGGEHGEIPRILPHLGITFNHLNASIEGARQASQCIMHDKHIARLPQWASCMVHVPKRANQMVFREVNHRREQFVQEAKGTRPSGIPFVPLRGRTPKVTPKAGSKDTAKRSYAERRYGEYYCQDLSDHLNVPPMSDRKPEARLTTYDDKKVIFRCWAVEGA